jgi:hypothetical protein
MGKLVTSVLGGDSACYRRVGANPKGKVDFTRLAGLADEHGDSAVSRVIQLYLARACAMDRRIATTAVLILALLACPVSGAHCLGGSSDRAAATTASCGCCHHDSSPEPTPVENSPERGRPSNCVCSGAIVVASVRPLATIENDSAALGYVAFERNECFTLLSDADAERIDGGRHFSRDASGRDVRTCCASFLL